MKSDDDDDDDLPLLSLKPKPKNVPLNQEDNQSLKRKRGKSPPKRKRGKSPRKSSTKKPGKIVKPLENQLPKKSKKTTNKKLKGPYINGEYPTSDAEVTDWLLKKGKIAFLQELAFGRYHLKKSHLPKDKKDLITRIVINDGLIKSIHKIIDEKQKKRNSCHEIVEKKNAHRKRIQDYQISTWEFLYQTLKSTSKNDLVITCYVQPCICYDWKQAHSGPGGSLIRIFQKKKTKAIRCRISLGLVPICKDGRYISRLDEAYKSNLERFIASGFKKAASKKQKIEFLKNCEIKVEVLEDVTYETLTPPKFDNGYTPNFMEKQHLNKVKEWQEHKIPKGYKISLQSKQDFDFYWLTGLEDNIVEREEEAKEKEMFEFRGSIPDESAVLSFSARDFIYSHSLHDCHIPTELITIVMDYISFKKK